MRLARAVAPIASAMPVLAGLLDVQGVVLYRLDRSGG